MHRSNLCMVRAMMHAMAWPVRVIQHVHDVDS